MFKKLAKLKPSVLTVGKLSPDDFFVVLDDAIRPWNPGDTIQGKTPSRTPPIAARTPLPPFILYIPLFILTRLVCLGKIVLVLTHAQPAISVTCNLSGAVVIKNQLVKGKHSRYGLIDDTITLWSAQEEAPDGENTSPEDISESSPPQTQAPTSPTRSGSSSTTTLTPSASASASVTPPPAAAKLLPRGEHYFAFAFDLPRRGLYNSLEFERGSISYVITAVLQRPGHPQFTCKKNISIICPIDVSTLPVPRPSMLSIEVRKKKKETGIITSMIEIPARGYLRGDSVQVTITVNHVKPVKSVHGVVVTLSRISRVCGGGLELQSFRKDLAQTVSSLITDPNTFSQTLSNKLRIPLDVFPTTTGHDMVSFQYCIEAVIDLAGKWNLQMTDDEMVGGDGGGMGGGIGSSGGIGGFLGSRGSGGHGGSGRFIDTDKLKKNRGTVSLWMELVIGTERGVVLNANRRQPQPGQYLSHHYQHYQRRPQGQPDSDQDLHRDQQQIQHQPQHQQDLQLRQQHDQQQQYGYQPRHIAHASSASNSINYHHAAPHAYNSQDNNNSLIMPGGSPIPPTAGYAGSAASSTPPISAEAEKERLRQEQEAAYLPSEPAPYAAGGSGSGRGSTLAVALPAASAADPASVLTEPSAPPLPDGATVGAVEAGDVVINSTSELATHHVPQQNTMYYPPPPQDPTHQPPGVVDKLERERLLLLDRSSQPYDVPTYVGPSSPPPPHIDSPSISGLAEARPEQVLHEKGSTEKVGLSSAPSEPESFGLESEPPGGDISDEPSAPPLEHVDLADLTLHEYEHAPSEPPAAAELGSRPGSHRESSPDAPSAPPAPGAALVGSSSNETGTISYNYDDTTAAGPAFRSGSPTNVLETIERNRVHAEAATTDGSSLDRPSRERGSTDDLESDSELYN